MCYATLPPQFDKSRYGDLLSVLHTITTEELVMAVRRQSQVGAPPAAQRGTGPCATLPCKADGPAERLGRAWGSEAGERHAERAGTAAGERGRARGVSSPLQHAPLSSGQ